MGADIKRMEKDEIKENKEEDNCCCCWPKPRNKRRLSAEEEKEFGDYEIEGVYVVAAAKVLNVLTVIYLFAIIVLIGVNMQQFNDARNLVEDLTKKAMIPFILNILTFLFNVGKVIAMLTKHEWQDMAIFFELCILCIGCVYSIQCIAIISSNDGVFKASISQIMMAMFVGQTVHFFLYVISLVLYCCSDTKFA